MGDNMEAELEALRITEEEEELEIIALGASAPQEDFSLCLVGTFMMDKTFNFLAMQNRIGRAVGEALGGFIGTFVNYDEMTYGTRSNQYMRVHVRMDVRKPLKRKKKIKKPGEYPVTCSFKYEKLPTFCFICEVMGHVERNYEIRFRRAAEEVVYRWDASLRALPRSAQPRGGERWLVDENVGRRGSSSMDRGGSQGRRVTSSGVAPNVQKLKSNFGASALDADKEMVDIERASQVEEQELEVGLKKKRRRDGESRVGGSMRQGKETVMESPTKKQSSDSQDLKNLVQAGFHGRTCPSS